MKWIFDLLFVVTFVLWISYSVAIVRVQQYEPHAIGETECITDEECYTECLQKLPPNRNEEECEI